MGTMGFGASTSADLRAGAGCPRRLRMSTTIKAAMTARAISEIPPARRLMRRVRRGSEFVSRREDDSVFNIGPTSGHTATEIVQRKRSIGTDHANDYQAG